MRLRVIQVVIAVLLFALSFPAQAQQLKSALDRIPN
jgi:hypothetical protein